MGVNPRTDEDAEYFEREWKNNRGEHIYRANPSLKAYKYGKSNGRAWPSRTLFFLLDCEGRSMKHPGAP
jgi:hypothetical protein